MKCKVLEVPKCQFIIWGIVSIQIICNVVNIARIELDHMVTNQTVKIFLEQSGLGLLVNIFAIKALKFTVTLFLEMIYI